MEQIITATSGRRQVRKARECDFTATKRQAFLDALGLSCNVARSALWAGVSESLVHRLRRKDPAFAAQWQTALEMGYDRLEALALEHSGAGVAIEPDAARAAAAGADAVPFDFDKALKLLTFHRAARHGQRQPARGGAPLRNATREETTAALMTALAAAKRRIERARSRGE